MSRTRIPISFYHVFHLPAPPLHISFEVAYLVETNVLGLLTEALTAQVKVVLADQTSLVLADAAKRMSC